jgi:predicted RNA-binding protein YlxR (DUF448 family)
VACRTQRQKRELTRVVRTPAGTVIVDPTGKAAGRGAYVCNDMECRRAALEKGSLQRALEVPIPPELRNQLTGEEIAIEGGVSRGQE